MKQEKILPVKRALRTTITFGLKTVLVLKNSLISSQQETVAESAAKGRLVITGFGTRRLLAGLPISVSPLLASDRREEIEIQFSETRDVLKVS